MQRSASYGGFPAHESDHLLMAAASSVLLLSLVPIALLVDLSLETFLFGCIHLYRRQCAAH